MWGMGSKPSPSTSLGPMMWVGMCSQTGIGYEIYEDISTNTFRLRMNSYSPNEMAITKQQAYDLKNGLTDLLKVVNGMSQEEYDELQELKAELKKWKQQQKLLLFQQMPAHIRQQIVDEALVSDTLKKMNNVPEAEFPEFTRLQQLRKMDLRSINFRYHDDMLGLQQAPDFKWASLFNQFTVEELIEAHTNATIEEEILQPETDSR